MASSPPRPTRARGAPHRPRRPRRASTSRVEHAVDHDGRHDDERLQQAVRQRVDARRGRVQKRLDHDLVDAQVQHRQGQARRAPSGAMPRTERAAERLRLSKRRSRPGVPTRRQRRTAPLRTRPSPGRAPPSVPTALPVQATSEPPPRPASERARRRWSGHSPRGPPRRLETRGRSRQRLRRRGRRPPRIERGGDRRPPAEQAPKCHTDRATVSSASPERQKVAQIACPVVGPARDLPQ